MDTEDSDLIKEFIEKSEESSTVDFKAIMYKNSTEHFVTDIISMANASGDEPKYLIIGVKDIPGREKVFVG